MKGQKAQIFSADFLVGIVVLFFILTTLQVHQSNVMQKIEKQHRFLYRESLVSRSDTLLLSQGIPENWNATSVEVPGLSTGEPNHLNETKVELFVGMDTSEIKRLLGFRGKDLYLSILNTSKEVVTANGTRYELGVKNWTQAENVYTIKREIVLGNSGKPGFMKVVVW